MKAIRVNQTGDPEVMKLEEVTKPEPDAGQVLVKIHAVGVNPVDTYIRAGNYGAVDLPYTPGLDAAGVVEAVGDGVTDVQLGDRVYTAGTITGAYAEYALCKEDQVYPLADKVSFAQGSAVFVPYATAYRALIQKAGAQPGQHVLIHGASGGVGTAAVQIAKANGIKVSGTAGTDDGIKLVKAQGADFAYNHHEDGYLDRAVKEATDGRGFNVIIEMLSNVNLDRDLDALAPEGIVVIVGCRGRVEIDPRKTMGKNLTITGMTVLSASKSETRSIHEALVAGLADGTMNPIVGQEFKLAEASLAHKAVLEPGSHGKIVLIP